MPATARKSLGMLAGAARAILRLLSVLRGLYAPYSRGTLLMVWGVWQIRFVGSKKLTPAPRQRNEGLAAERLPPRAARALVLYHCPRLPVSS